MKIVFTEARELLSGRIVAEGEEVDVSDEDGAAFVQNGVAKASDGTASIPANAAIVNVLSAIAANMEEEPNH